MNECRHELIFCCFSNEIKLSMEFILSLNEFSIQIRNSTASHSFLGRTFLKATNKTKPFALAPLRSVELKICFSYFLVSQNNGRERKRHLMLLEQICFLLRFASIEIHYFQSQHGKSEEAEEEAICMYFVCDRNVVYVMS